MNALTANDLTRAARLVEIEKDATSALTRLRKQSGAFIGLCTIDSTLAEIFDAESTKQVLTLIRDAATAELATMNISVERRRKKAAVEG